MKKISKSYYSSGRFDCPQWRIRRRKSLRSQAGGRILVKCGGRKSEIIS